MYIQLRHLDISNGKSQLYSHNVPKVVEMETLAYLERSLYNHHETHQQQPTSR